MADPQGGVRRVPAGRDRRSEAVDLRLPGADIESYLSAVEDPSGHRTLATNWRSDGPLIAALDALLTGSTFGDDRIGYRRVRAADQNRTARIRGVGEALEIRRFSDDFPLPRQQYKPFFYVADARKEVAADVAAEVVRLLDDEVSLKGNDGEERRLAPGDIAVLCRTGHQVGMIRDALAAASVPSVVARTGSVFATPAAEHWRRFLLAVERPSRADYLRLAATTPLVGMNLPEVAGLGRRHDPRPAATLPAVAGSAARPRGTGDVRRHRPDDGSYGPDPLPVRGREGTDRPEPHRRGDACRLAEGSDRVAGGVDRSCMEEATRNAEANVEDAESRQRRLDTDAAAVQVLTVHAAKGLEYPVVMAPYLWDIPRIKPGIPVFHDPEPAPEGEPRRRVIDVGGPTSPGFESHQEAAMDEDAAEEGRLLYVALTRAKHRLVVWWIENTWNSAKTKLHRILSRGGDPDSEIERLIGVSGGTIGQTVLTRPQPAALYSGEHRTPSRLERARLDRPLDYFWRRVSFTSLSPDRPLGGEPDTTDEPDRIDEPAEVGEAGGPGGGLLMDDLPRGARFGSLVHRIFQNVAFDAPDLPAEIGSELARLTRQASWDFETDAFVRGMTAAIRTPLGPGDDAPSLRDLDPGRTLKEMDFELPLRTSASTITLRDIAAVMLERLDEDDPHRGYFSRLHELEPHRFRGFLAGGIDLVTVVRDAAATAMWSWTSSPTPFLPQESYRRPPTTDRAARSRHAPRQLRAPGVAVPSGSPPVPRMAPSRLPAVHPSRRFHVPVRQGHDRSPDPGRGRGALRGGALAPAAAGDSRAERSLRGAPVMVAAGRLEAAIAGPRLWPARPACWPPSTKGVRSRRWTSTPRR